MNKIDQRKNIRRFIDEWSSPSKGREISDNQPFWIALMRDVFGVAQPEALFQFERPVRGLGRIDALMEGAGVLIEQLAQRGLEAVGRLRIDAVPARKALRRPSRQAPPVGDRLQL